MVQPGGATKKPQESMLKNFAKNCENLEPNIIFSIMYYVLSDTKISWISKYVSLLAMPVLCGKAS